MNAQEIFDTVAKHLFAQGHRAVGDDGASAREVCLYRAPNGDKCAFGVLIPNECYDPLMENHTARQVIYGWACLEQFEDHVNLIGAMQRLHDAEYAWFSGERLKDRLREVAEDFALSITVLDGLTLAGVGHD